MATDSCCVLLHPTYTHSVVNIRQHVNRILHFLNTYGWLTDAYVSDFFVMNYWDWLLPSWRTCFAQMTAPDIAELLSYNQTSHDKVMLPLSLLAYRSCIQNLSLKRAVASDNELNQVLESLHSGTPLGTTQLPTVCHVTTDPKTVTNVQYRGSQYISLDAQYRKHVKPKKQHEIDQMSKVIGHLCQLIKCGKIVDVGAGLGHLSRLLNFKYGLDVTTIEATGGHAPKAHKFDLDLKKEIKKKKKKMEALQQQSDPPDGATGYNGPEDKNMSNLDDSGTNMLPSHLIHQVDTNISPTDFLKILQMHDLNYEQDLHTESSNLAIPAVSSHSSEVQFSESQFPPQQVSLIGTTQFTDSVSSTNCNTPVSHISSDNNGSNEKYLKIYVSGVTEDSDISRTIPDSQQQQQKHSNSKQLIQTLVHTDSKLNQSGLTPSCENTTIIPCKSSSTPNLSEEKITEKEQIPNGEQVVLCGLHACGDLTATMIRIFTQSQHIVALASVGCCYMKLSTPSDGRASPMNSGYPMSHHLQSIQHHLTYEAREMACHFVDAYRNRLIDNEPSLQRHWYRASLQYVVKALDPDFKHGCVKIAIKNVENLSFEMYLEKALKYLGFDISQVPPGIIEQCKQTSNQWKDVVCFYTVRLSLAPVVETLLLLDRLLYLLESGFSCALVPIFEPVLSPRNFILLATKQPS